MGVYFLLQPKEGHMSERNLIGVARDLIDAFNAKDSERFKKQLASNVVYDEVGTNRKSHGADAWLQVWEQWRSAFPDVKGTITNAVASGNTVVQEITWQGTHGGPLASPTGTVKPSGKRQITRTSLVLVFENDRVKESRLYFDMLSLLQQIGAMPQQAGAAAS
jgi:steroid delta-isomerase-like uncharacterized protein